MRSIPWIVMFALSACDAAPPIDSQELALRGALHVPTQSGVAHGIVHDGVRAFRGLRYAAAPVGDLRWRDPTPPPICPRGTCDAANFGPMCLQVRAGATVGSEDCLMLNVFTPIDARPGEDLPVLFFVHGGGLTGGFASDNPKLNPPRIVADQRVVLVTFEYRINVFGLLAHPLLTAESGGSADHYLLDTIAALEWVQRNIRGFGGDRARVMLFGQSAGAFVVGMALAAPRARGLFATAAMESGPPSHALPSLADCEPQGRAISAAVGCAGAADELACLRSAPANDLLGAFNASAFAPPCPDVPIDGRLIARQPLDIIRDDKTVPLMIGENSNESGQPIDAPVTADDYVAFVHEIYDPFGAEAVDGVLRRYALDRFQTPAEAENVLFNDFAYGHLDREWALAAAADRPRKNARARPVYRYVFTHAIENDLAIAAEGAFHTLELSFVFGTILDGNAVFGPYSPSPAEKRLAQQMEGYWARFAATGDPNRSGAVFWPRFQPRSEDYLDLDDAPKAGTRYHAEECEYLSRFAAPR